MSEPLPIIADVPSTRPGLGFAEYVQALADAVRGGQPPQFSIGLYGAWGSGKSSLLNALARSLESPDGGVIPVLFDAWRYERADHIVVPLLHRITEAAKASGATDLAKTLQRALGALISSLRFTIGSVGIDVAAGKKTWDASAMAPLDAAFSEPFAQFQKVPTALAGRRIAVLIDDLDRCSPENVVSVLETINLVMDVPGIIFVLALDYDVLVKAVQVRYPHVSGHSFIEKLIQLPFRVPPLDVTGTDFLQELLPTWTTLSKSLPEPVIQCAPDIAELGLRRNPRQLKRFFNSLLVIDRIMSARDVSVGYELLAAMVALQLGWPDEHRLLQDAVFLDSENPIAELEPKLVEDAALASFARRFLPSDGVNPDELRMVLQLTAVVAAAPEEVANQPSGVPADQVREDHRQRLVDFLTDQGFEPSRRKAGTYYYPGLPDVRVGFRQHNVNIERRDSSGRWHMYEQFLLTKRLDEALTAIASVVSR